MTILNSQVTGFTPEGSIFPERPIMEYVLNQYVDNIIYLNRINDQRWAHLIHSKILPNRKIGFSITTSGIVD